METLAHRVKAMAAPVAELIVLDQMAHLPMLERSELVAEHL